MTCCVTLANGKFQLSVLKTEQLACEEKEAVLPRQRLIIDVLHDTVANGKCRLSVLKTERLACEDRTREVCMRDSTK